MGFWKSNPFVPSWSSFLGQAWCSVPPKLLETLHVRRPVQVPRGCDLRAALPGDFSAIIEFWSRYFSVQRSCRCIVPLAHLQSMVLKGLWEVIIVVRQGTHEILGSIVRRRIRNLHIREAKWISAGVIDYYCVHPAWRKRGIGNALLDVIHNTAHSSASAPMPPQLIFWEGLHPLYPPLSVGVFWVRKCSASASASASASTALQKISDSQESLKAWRILQQTHGNQDIWTEEPGEETSIWKTSTGPVAVWNSFHCTVPHGLSIGVVLGGSVAAINELANTATWGILLVPRINPLTHDLGNGWTLDSPFQWIGYNLSVGFISSEFPFIGF